jgi:hypothetical protein
MSQNSTIHTNTPLTHDTDVFVKCVCTVKVSNADLFLRCLPSYTWIWVRMKMSSVYSCNKTHFLVHYKLCSLAMLFLPPELDFSKKLKGYQV